MSYHDWNIAFDGVIQCQKCWKYVDEGIEGECYAVEHTRADCEGCGDTSCPCNREGISNE